MRILTVVFVLAGLSSCKTATNALTTSAALPELSSAASSAIAGDMVSRLSEQIGPATGIIVLKQDASLFGQALFVALKKGGYAIVTDQEIDSKAPRIQLAYVVDSFEGQTLARLSTRKIELTRAYSTNAAGASPVSPLSIMQRS